MVKKLWAIINRWLNLPLSFERGYENALDAATDMNAIQLHQSIDIAESESPMDEYDRGWVRGCRKALRMRGWES